MRSIVVLAMMLYIWEQSTTLPTDGVASRQSLPREEVPAVRSSKDPSERNDWSLLGFLHDCISSRAKFRRLMALIGLLLGFILGLVLLLLLGIALAKGDIASAYGHLTMHARWWEKWGIPPGGITLTLAGIKFFRYRRAVARTRAAEAVKARRAVRKRDSTGQQGDGRDQSG